MKTQFVRVSALGAAATSLMLCAGCEEYKAGAQVPVVTAIAQVSTNTRPTAPGPSTNAAPVEAKVVQKAMPPDTLQMSPALADIVKLTQAGLTDEVLLAYITNAPRVFGIGSEEILYLNDLGVSSAVITAVIQNDSSPEVLALKKAAAESTTLPPGLALNAPAGNLYPTAVSGTPPAVEPAAPTYVTQPPLYQAEPATAQYATQPHVAYFYDSLSPYGNWITVDGYGACWQPTVAVVNSYWQPYADRGRWLWSDNGWYWYSDYSWGWAPFHYGRWHSSPSVGWFWIPDTTWGPAWVTWRQTSSHCGWAPLPPGAVYASGGGFSFHGSAVSASFGFGLGLAAYSWVPFARFCDRDLYRHRVAHAHAATIYKDSVVVNNYINGNNNTIINQGVGIRPVVNATGADVPKVAIRETPSGVVKASRPERLEGTGASAVVYRPQLPSTPPQPTSTGARPRPNSTQTSAATTKLNSSTGPASAAPTANSASTKPASTQVEVTRTGNALTIARRPVPDAYPSSPPAVPAKATVGSTASTTIPPTLRPVLRPTFNGTPAPVVTTPSSKAAPTPPTTTANTSVEPIATKNPVQAQPQGIATRQPIIIRSPTASASRPNVATPIAPESFPGAGRPSYRQPVPAVAAPKTATPGPMQPLGASRPLAVPQPVTAPQPVRPTAPISAGTRAEAPRSYNTPPPAPAFTRPTPVVREPVSVPAPRPSYDPAPRSFTPSVRPEPVRPQPSAAAPTYSAPTASVPVARPQPPAAPPSKAGQANEKKP